MVMDGDAENYINDPNIEIQWAMEAGRRAEAHYKLLERCGGKNLNLTMYDDQIYQKFREDFPDFHVKNIDEKELKSAAAKEKWREFCMEFKEMKDYNVGTLIRLSCEKDYSPDNSIIVVRIQFLAIEIARNREGINLPLLKE
ncbi:hypothetical protein SNEBB_003627 [Seison nebaliae]|nr:hypothetical protein SNEBB_003627 [Seison nebaliae]